MIAVAAYRRAIAYSDLVAEIRSLDLEPQSEQFGTPSPSLRRAHTLRLLSAATLARVDR
ncbi:MAG: hypothetical protein OXT64_12955 [Gammaproteobacteria bacterium]|nr:hypothetical protein [Gammaproteobacteria bacterium]